MHRARFVLCAAALALALSARGSSATEIVHLDTRALVLESSDIVVGHVQSTRSYWNASHTKIFTDVTVGIAEALKGGAGAQLTLTQLGGEVDGVRYNVPLSPMFTPGEDALLFVWRGPSGRAQVNGLSQGKFEIRTDAAGRRTVQRALPGLAVSDARSLRLVPEGARAPEIPLDAMMGEIRRVLQEGGR
jgi:hypothetical protein